MPILLLARLSIIHWPIWLSDPIQNAAHWLSPIAICYTHG